MPALTAVAAAAAIAQISLHPGGLLPHLAPYLQPYLPPPPQHTPLQHQLLHERMQSSAAIPPRPFPFAQPGFLNGALPR